MLILECHSLSKHCGNITPTVILPSPEDTMAPENALLTYMGHCSIIRSSTHAHALAAVNIVGIVSRTTLKSLETSGKKINVTLTIISFSISYSFPFPAILCVQRSHSASPGVSQMCPVQGQQCTVDYLSMLHWLYLNSSFCRCHSQYIQNLSNLEDCSCPSSVSWIFFHNVDIGLD